MKLTNILAFTSILLLSQTSCVPLAIFGGAGAIGYTAAQDRSIGATIDDAGIEAQINAKFLSQPDKELFVDVDPDAVEGRVLLTGTVPTREAKIKAYNLALEAKGAKDVINEIKVDPNSKFSARRMAQDAWISTQIESRLLFAEDVSSINYSIETIDGVVYLMGIAKDREELDTVTQVASEVPGVQKVVSYVKVKNSDGTYSGGNKLSTTPVETQTVPGSVRAREATTPIYRSNDLVIEESPNAQ